MSKQEIACRWASRYKALRPPKCRCLSCELKWVRRQVDTLAAYMQEQRERDRRNAELESYI